MPGAKRDGQDQHSQTPVFLACKEGNEDIVQLLVDNFVNIKIPDNVDQLPVDIAVERGHQKIVDTLTNFKHSVNGHSAQVYSAVSGQE